MGFKEKIELAKIRRQQVDSNRHRERLCRIFKWDYLKKKRQEKQIMEEHIRFRNHMMTVLVKRLTSFIALKRLYENF